MADNKTDPALFYGIVSAVTKYIEQTDKAIGLTKEQALPSPKQPLFETSDMADVTPDNQLVTIVGRS
jgi:hypothetical protein